VFPALPLKRFRLPALTLIVSAITLTACNAPPSSNLPLAPEAASGYRTGLQASHADKHMAAAANPLAAEAGREMLRKGGSAIDAAIAMQAVLTLVEPQSSGIGGGAMIVLWDGKQVRTYDGRETAPAGATEKLFLQADGKPMPFPQAQIGGRSVGTPGVMRALEMAHKQHGRLPWATLFEPAIKLAEQGFAISPRLHSLLESDPVVRRSPDMARYFLNSDGSVKAIGTRLQNPALAAVLKRIATEGADALYKGPIAEEIVAKVQGHANPGSLSLNDLQHYQAKERAPLCTDYKRWQVCGMPPPSSGGIAVAQILGTLQALETRDPRLSLTPLKPVKTDKPAGLEPAPQAVHLIAEAERLAYADRGLYVADSDFVLWESNSILQYAADKYGCEAAYPHDLEQRADINRWMFWEAANWFPSCYVFLVENCVKPLLGAQPDAAVLHAQQVQFHKLAGILNQRLAGRDWVVGKGPTIADIALAAPMHLHGWQQLPLADHPHLKRWLTQNVESLPCWQKTWVGEGFKTLAVA